ncbi:MAG: DUF805 domain-containing protein [Oscillospiraceae bacterium]|nr:DUF805 domain-containing protein [Oscillospiraceae bacterium]
MLFCKQCGSQYENGTAFCPVCGAATGEQAQAQPVYAQPQPQYAPPAQPQYAPPQPQYAPPQPQPYYQQPQYAPPAQPYAQPNPYGAPQGVVNPLAAQKVGFGEAIKLFFQKYAKFEGRASKSEFWWSYLFCLLISWTYIGALVVLIPMLAVSARRLHDVGKSGWYYLMGLIPLVGWIFVLIAWCKDSEPGDNQYGPGAGAYNPYQTY